MLNKCCAAYPAGEHWVLAVDPEACINNEDEASITEEEKPPVAIHFVVDNSGSMGSMTREVMYIFADMVDSVATAPCSMTVFAGNAQTLNANITSAKQMRELQLPAQGMTNIPAGVENAINIITLKERQRMADGATIPRTHHVLILLSDGHHNTGAAPDKVFPTFKTKIPDDAMLSTIVVGLSEQSSTSMGMLLKKSIETVSFQTESVQTIYFAKTNSALRTILGNLEAGLNSAVQGTFHEITTPFPAIIQDFASKPKETIRVHANSDTTCIPLLCCFADVPKSIRVNGQEISVAAKEEIPFDLLTTMIQGLIDKTKVKIVAAKDRKEVISKSVKYLDILYNLVKAHQDSDVDLNMTSLSAKERVKQYRQIRALTHKAGELKNQIVDIANFSINDSEGQAAFLNGRSMKFANKALRRAAGRADGVVDPKAEQKAIHKYLTSEGFREKLKAAMALDTIFNAKNLSEKDLRQNIFPRVVAQRHKDQIWEIRKKASVLENEMDTDLDSLNALSLSPGALDLIHSGQLADYLNDGVHGRAQSFVSMATPWQHAEEWLHFGEQPFESCWEMLMYGGMLGFPIRLKRFAACQMNPFLLEVENIRSTLVDSASICCSNKAEVPVYGPEAGAPIEDVLLLIQPSLPRTSKLLNNTALLGEKFTSVTISRDMHMYTGFSMRVALHSTSLFHLAATQDEATITEHDVVANLRRAFMGRAFMCGNCNFGPVDHYACGDLMSHHGENTGSGAKISNDCPKCGWFSECITDWSPWDGNVDEDYLRSEFDSISKKPKQHFLSEARIDMMLKVMYSFRKLCKGRDTWDQYQQMADAMENVDDVPLDFSTKAGVDGMSQVALALMAVLTESKNATKVFESKDVLMAILKEECARDARSRFRMETGGEKEMARQKAMEFLTKLLQIAKETAPETQPFMESEPPIENVRLDCRDDYQVDTDMGRQLIPWVRDICRKWCRLWSVAEKLASVLSKRVGGWEQLERDMETGMSSYADVVQELKRAELKTPRDLLGNDEASEGCDLSELQTFFMQLGVEGIVFGAAESSLPGYNNKAEEDDLMSAVAREMRMRIYFQGVAAKMSQWKSEGQTATFSQARVADIVQFADLLGAKPHVHGLDKQTFWGLWLAAVSTHDEQKALAFLETCNESFRFKYGNAWKPQKKRGGKS
ncbi:unnamed protein product [Cylindrotheca closterium]|uniref:VWFA domain-containing protein n=1 Tax=Cylindrotheca closterium TaxID=2856 RepID=A0AAD2JM45_9STRA|nr:unnamed protein product [Cylindrotheca closterium]